MAKLLSRVENSLILCRVHFLSTTNTEERTEWPVSWKRDSWGKITKKNNCWAPSKRLNRRKLVDQYLQTKLNKLRRLNTKIELELIKNLESFLDGHGNSTSNFVSFKTKSLHTNRFLKGKEICINHLVQQMI